MEEFNTCGEAPQMFTEHFLLFVSLQKINHFPGMNEICRKDSLARNMNRMLKLFPKDYNIFPRTWCLPAESVFLLSLCFNSSLYSGDS